MGIEPERIVNTMTADDLVAWTETHATAEPTSVRASPASRRASHRRGRHEAEQHELGGVADEGGARSRVPEGGLDAGVAVAGVAGALVGEEPARAGRSRARGA